MVICGVSRAEEPTPEPPDEPASAKTVIVAQGQITDPMGGGLSGATVRLFRHDDWPEGKPIATTETDQVGDFKVGVTEALSGQLVLVVTQMGCTDLVHNFERAPNDPPAFFGATLEGNLTLRGRVIDKASQKAVAGATVRFNSITGEKTTASDDDGRFFFKALSAGSTELVVEAVGFGRERLPFDEVESITEDVVVELKPQRTISIALVDDHSHAIRGVVIECFDRAHDHFVAATTDDSGKAEIAGWHYDTESIAIRLTHDEHVSDVDFDRTLSVPEDDLNASASFIMRRAGKIKGRVVNADQREPVYGARVITGDDYSDSSPRDWTDTEGRFEIRGVAPGTVTVTVHASGHAPELQKASIQAGGIAELQFALDESRELSGIVKAKSGDPIAGSEIRTLEWRGATTLALRAISDAKGLFTLRDAPQDSFEIAVFAEGFKMLRHKVDPSQTEPLVFVAEPLPDRSASGGSHRLRAGDKAPEFRLTSLDRTTYSSDNLRGKFVILDFWATWCAPCVDELPILAKIYEQYGSRDDFALIGVSRDFELAELRRFLRRRESFAAWPHAFGEENGVEQTRLAFGVSAIPRLFIIGPDGIIIDSDLRGDRLVSRVDAIMKAAEEAKASGAP